MLPRPPPPPRGAEGGCAVAGEDEVALGAAVVSEVVAAVVDAVDWSGAVAAVADTFLVAFSAGGEVDGTAEDAVCAGAGVVACSATLASDA